MIWLGDSILMTGWMLRRPTSTVTTQAVMVMGRQGTAVAMALTAWRVRVCGSRRAQKASSKQARAGMMVSQLRKERFPLRMRTTCRRIMTMPAIWRAILGPKAKSGATSSASQLNQTPIRSRRRGRKWNHRLKGPGMGWVSK